MRITKLLKITGIAVSSVVILVLLLVTAFVYNPFEASLPVMKDVVPRDVHACVRKADLLADFEGHENAFPVIPAVKDLFRREAWQRVLSGPAARALGVDGGLERSLAEARRTFQELRDSHIHLVRDVLGEEVLVAGRFVSRNQTQWCAYLSVSWRIRFAYGLLKYGFVQEQLRQNGILVQMVGDDPPFYRVRPRGSPQDLFVIRERNCLMVSNDQALARESYECAVGGPGAPEPLARSSHYQEGVEDAIEAWQRRTGVPDPNILEVFLEPRQLMPLVPQLRRWPNPKSDDRNTRILAAFVKPQSWRFLSGALIFEPNSLSVLLDLEVDNTQHTSFLKDFFKTEREDRSRWMDDFIGMVPASSVAAASLRMPAGGFLHKMHEQGLDPAEKDVINDTLRQTTVYKNVTDLIDKVKLSFLPRVGIVFSKNVRNKKLREYFPVQQETAMPQWVWVFWVAPGRGQPVQEFVNTLKKHMGAFGFTNAYKLPLLRGSSADVAFEFAHSLIAGTGALAVCTYGLGAGRGQTQYFFVGNSGELIQKMVRARLDKVPSLRSEPDYRYHFEPELPNALNGLVWISGTRTREVLQALLDEWQQTGERPPPEWDLANRPLAERTVLYKKYPRYSRLSQIPRSLRQRFEEDVTRELDKMWEKRKAAYSAAGREKMEQWIHLTQALRSAYLQVVLDPHSLQLTGRILTTEYR